MTSRPNNKTIQQRFAEVLRRRREAAGLSQESLAADARLHRNCIGRLDGLIHVEDHTGECDPGGEFFGVERFVVIGLADGEKLQCGRFVSR